MSIRSVIRLCSSEHKLLSNSLHLQLGSLHSNTRDSGLGKVGR